MSEPVTQPDAGSAIELPLEALVSGLGLELARGRHHDLLAPLRYLDDPSTELSGAAVDRGALAAGLARANASYGHPRAEELAAQLADPRTRVVVTGQQAGIGGGRLYTLSKMVAAVRWADWLRRQGEPAVAVFWVATEDHDYLECARLVAGWGDRATAIEPPADSEPLRPVGMRSVAELAALLDKAAGEHHQGPGAEWARSLLGRAYRPDARMGEAFSRFLIGLLGDRAPLLLDSMLPELKAAQRPWLRRLVERRADVAAGEAAATEQVSAQGFSPQVPIDRDASPLFVLHGNERRRVLWSGDEHFELRGVEGSRQPVAALLERIDDNPSVVSPGVLARPALQDACLGTALQVMGPGELAYLCQASATYEVIGAPAPHTVLRSQLLVLDPRCARYLDKLPFSLATLLGDEQELRRQVADHHGFEAVTKIRSAIDQQLGELASIAEGIEPQLASPYEKTRDSIQRALDTFEEKATAAVARQDEVLYRRLGAIRDQCLPCGSSQERTASVLAFACEYGEAGVAAMLEQIGQPPKQVAVIVPGGAPAGDA